MSDQEGQGCNFPLLLVLVGICLQEIILDNDFFLFTVLDLYQLSKVKCESFLYSVLHLL